MPHDSKGQPVAAGDKVTITFDVKSVTQGEKDCNVSLEALNPQGQSENYLPSISCNAKLTTKAVLLVLCLFLSAAYFSPATAAEDVKVIAPVQANAEAPVQSPSQKAVVQAPVQKVAVVTHESDEPRRFRGRRLARRENGLAGRVAARLCSRGGCH